MVSFNLNSVFEIINYSPIKSVRLYIIEPSKRKMTLKAQTLQNLFITLRKKKLQYLRVILHPTLDESTSGEELEQLQHSFTELLEN